MEPLLTAFIFVFGAIIGSFLNAVLWRLHSGESVARGRSHCVACGHPLSVRDLVPVLSWLWLRGKCRYCAKDIGISYLAVEIATGLLFVAGAQATKLDLAALLLAWYLIATYVVIFTFDLRHMLILRSVTLPATIIALAANVALGMPPWSLALGIAFGAGFFWLQYAFSKGRWIGGGDIQLGALMGATLGWPMTLAAIMMAYITGAIYGVVVLATGRKHLKSEIPFGTFLSVSAVAMLLWGERIVAWYFGLFA